MHAPTCIAASNTHLLSYAVSTRKRCALALASRSAPEDILDRDPNQINSATSHKIEYWTYTYTYPSGIGLLQRDRHTRKGPP